MTQLDTSSDMKNLLRQEVLPGLELPDTCSTLKSLSNHPMEQASDSTQMEAFFGSTQIDDTQLLAGVDGMEYFNDAFNLEPTACDFPMEANIGPYDSVFSWDQPMVPEELIDPLLRDGENVPDVPLAENASNGSALTRPDDTRHDTVKQESHLFNMISDHTTDWNAIMQSELPYPPINLPPRTPRIHDLKSHRTSKRSTPGSAKLDSTFDLTRNAAYQLYDPRLYSAARRFSTPYKCQSPSARYLHKFSLTPSKPETSPYHASIAASAVAHKLSPADPTNVTNMANSMELTDQDFHDLLDELDPSFLDPNFVGDFAESLKMDAIAKSKPLPSFDEFKANICPPSQSEHMSNAMVAQQMLAVSPQVIRPCEKRKRGRPKKNTTEESTITETEESTPLTPCSQKLAAAFSVSAFPPLGHFAPPPPPVSPCEVGSPLRRKRSLPESRASESVSEAPEADDRPSKRRKLTSRGLYRAMSKKEQAYLDMDKKVQLFDENNIHELLMYPKLKPGRTPCFWIQRHPYANTRVYSDHYRTWCRYRNCKGVETNELIQTASGELKVKNYKHPRTIIAGNYQVAVDWEYVHDETAVFKNDRDGEYEYDKRNVYDTIECFFHLRCFEQLLNFPNLIRSQIVQFDHRVLDKDKSRNRVAKRKNKGGTNAAEIEWYLKDEANDWIEKIRSDSTFNPAAGDEESLERLLLKGKRLYSEKKGTFHLNPKPKK